MSRGLAFDAAFAILFRDVVPVARALLSSPAHVNMDSNRCNAIPRVLPPSVPEE